MSTNYNTPKNKTHSTDKKDKFIKFSFENSLRKYENIPTPIWKNMSFRKLNYFKSKFS